jgi:hypothetical protein
LPFELVSRCTVRFPALRRPGRANGAVGARLATDPLSASGRHGDPHRASPRCSTGVLRQVVTRQPDVLVRVELWPRGGGRVPKLPQNVANADEFRSCRSTAKLRESLQIAEFGRRAAWIAPRRSSVRVRRAPSTESPANRWLSGFRRLSRKRFGRLWQRNVTGRLSATLHDALRGTLSFRDQGRCRGGTRSHRFVPSFRRWTGVSPQRLRASTCAGDQYPRLRSKPY